jgi:hypothetical protein
MNESMNVDWTQFIESQSIASKVLNQEASDEWQIIDQCRRCEAAFRTQKPLVVSREFTRRGPIDGRRQRWNTAEVTQVFEYLERGGPIIAPQLAAMLTVRRHKLVDLSLAKSVQRKLTRRKPSAEIRNKFTLLLHR